MKREDKKTILLVEDQFLTALAEKKGLEKYGYEVVIANCGEKALELVAADPAIDLILMDINLGAGMDGTEAAEKILKGREIPIVFLSNHTEAEIVERTERISSHGYVVKSSGLTILDTSIKTAFKLFAAYGKTKAINSRLAATFDAIPGLRLKDNDQETALAKRYETALAASEMRYRRLFESAKDGILILDAETGKIVDVNPFLIEMLGYSKRQFIEKAVWEIGAFKDIVANKENFLELQRNEYLRYEDMPLETARGETVAVEFISNVYLVDGKKVIQCNVRNISDRKMAEALIAALLSEKELILKEVHHRIKNNMSTIAGLLALQADALEMPAAKTALKDAEGRVKSMMQLYNKLYQSGGFKSVSVLEYLPSLISDILENFPNSASVKVAKIIDDFSLDAKMLQPLAIIINELLTNIMKYAFSGIVLGVITVSARLKGGKVALGIEDNGNGMPESIDFNKSPGFGLMLVGMLTKQLNGTIRIERGQGTRIVLEFDA
jgi:PAS domain S-box-containing protein